MPLKIPLTYSLYPVFYTVVGETTIIKVYSNNYYSFIKNAKYPNSFYSFTPFCLFLLLFLLFVYSFYSYSFYSFLLLELCNLIKGPAIYIIYNQFWKKSNQIESKYMIHPVDLKARLNIESTYGQIRWIKVKSLWTLHSHK